MDEYEQMVGNQRRWMLYLLGLFLIGAFITPFQRVFMGLMLGHVVSYYSLRLLHRNITRFGKAVLGEGSTVGLGTFLRLISAGIAIFIALKFEEEFHLIAVVIGLLTSYVVMFIDVTLRTVKNK